jgi:hypothetical protein
VILHQKRHVAILLALAIFFYLASAISSLLFALHRVGSDFLNPTALDYFRSLMLVSLAMLDPQATAVPPRTVPIPSTEVS